MKLQWFVEVTQKLVSCRLKIRIEGIKTPENQIVWSREVFSFLETLYLAQPQTFIDTKHKLKSISMACHGKLPNSFNDDHLVHTKSFKIQICKMTEGNRQPSHKA